VQWQNSWRRILPYPDYVSISLPILPLATPGQRYSCHGCGNCCRDFTVQLRPDDSQRIRQQAWETRIGTNPIVVFRGQEYLRQLPDGACIFLLDDGRCRIHAEYGSETKPVACQMFPYMLAPSETASQMGVSFACQSVVENKGKQYNEQVSDALKIVLRGIPEVVRPARSAAISRSRRAEAGELDALKSRAVRWIQRDAPLHQRVDGLAWIAQTLSVAQLNKVRGSRFKELVDLLFDALADELPLHPIGSAIPRQIALFQGSVFARTEDPKPVAQGAPGRFLSTISQLRRNRLWRRGIADTVVPPIGIGWPTTATFGHVAQVNRVRESSELTACDELISRWMRSSIEGGRIWGSGYYGWNAVDGFSAFVLSAATIGWLARLHAVGSKAHAPSLANVQAAVGRIDRTAGRAVWLGGWSERMRLAYLVRDDGLRRLVASQF